MDMNDTAEDKTSKYDDDEGNKTNMDDPKRVIKNKFPVWSWGSHKDLVLSAPRTFCEILGSERTRSLCVSQNRIMPCYCCKAQRLQGIDFGRGLGHRARYP